MKTKNTLLIASLILILLSSCNQTSKEATENSEDTTMEENATPEASTSNDGVYFVNLTDGEEVTSPVIIEMGVEGMTVEPAGEVHEGKGHHHIIVDGMFIEKGEGVPMNETHLHFGKGQTADTLALAAGEHTLTLQFADGIHASYGKDWSKTITIKVVE